MDDFKDEMGLCLPRTGDLHVSEESYDFVSLKSVGKDGKEKESTVAKIKFKFVLNHISGESSEPTFFTVSLPYTGAQTSGAAQSYAIKEGVYKGLFQASSGDVSEEADLQGGQSSERLTKADARPLEEALRKEMYAVEKEDRSSESLATWWRDNIEQITVLP